MTKILYLVRHAKSSWKDASLDDFDRPLNKRGKRDAPEMGRRLAKEDIVPKLIISSPAERAKKTALAIAKAVGYDTSNIQWEENLYHARPVDLLRQVHTASDQSNSLMLIGHNPGLTDFCNDLSPEEIENIVTVGIVCLKFEVDKWKGISLAKTGKLAWYDYPKKVKW